MNDHSSPVPEDQEVGRPIAGLMDIEQDTAPTFLVSVRKRIYRRMTASELASFSVNVPKLLLLEAWNVIVQVLAPRAGKKGPS